MLAESLLFLASIMDPTDGLLDDSPVVVDDSLTEVAIPRGRDPALVTLRVMDHSSGDCVGGWSDSNSVRLISGNKVTMTCVP